MGWISLHEIFFLDAIQVYNSQFLLYKSTTVSSHCASVQQSAPTGGPLSERIFYYKNYLIKFPFYLTSNRSGVLLARERWQITENIFSLRRFRQLTIGIINSIWHY